MMEGHGVSSGRRHRRRRLRRHRLRLLRVVSGSRRGRDCRRRREVVVMQPRVHQPGKKT